VRYLVVAALLVSPPALAWVSMDGNTSPPNPVWASTPVHWSMNQNGSADMGVATSETVCLDSFASWSAPSCTSWATVYDGTTPAMPGGSGQVVGWQESGWPYGSGAIGVTSVAFGGPSTIVHADITFNGVNYTWTTSGGGGSSVDAQSIATHEMGHFLGLGDLYGGGCAGEPTMCGIYSGGTGARTLAADDIDGVCALYPAPACTGDGDCPAGQRCVDGFCVEAPEPGDPCDPCTAHEDCGGDSDLCLSGFPDGGMYCGKACASPADCPTGYDCIAVGGAPSSQCVPATWDCHDIPECLENDDCVAPLICLDGACVPEPDCYTDDDCPEGEICQDGACIPDPFPHLPWCSVCTSHDDCGGPDDLCMGGFVDGSSRCGVSCDSVGGDCGPGKLCYHFEDAPDQCIPDDMNCSDIPPDCASDADCAPGQVCSGGTCIDVVADLVMVSGCGCSLPGARPAPGLALALALALACGVLLRRRRSRDPSSR
jgi:Cys-rich repeat protein